MSRWGDLIPHDAGAAEQGRCLCGCCDEEETPMTGPTVYVAGRGDYWHTRPDCPGIRGGQAAADTLGGEVQDVREVPRDEARRLPGMQGSCSRCLTVAEFLYCRYDEEADEALAASPGPWHANPEADEVLADDGITVADGFALSGRQLRATTSHIARWNPERVLVEIDAKLAIVDEAFHHEAKIDSEWGCCHTAEQIAAGLCPEHNPDDIPILRTLAAVYEDHPEYEEAWKP